MVKGLFLAYRLSDVKLVYAACEFKRYLTVTGTVKSLARIATFTFTA